MHDPTAQVRVQSEAYVIANAKTTANNARNVVRTSILVGYILSLTIPIYARLRLPSTFVLQPPKSTGPLKADARRLPIG